MKLKKYLSTYDIRLSEFAKLSKLKISYLSQIKDGHKTPSLKVALAIKKATNGAVCIEDLINSK
jgi:DNA-binding transcriptional regulator YdaS (Cro superfamily)